MSYVCDSSFVAGQGARPVKTQGVKLSTWHVSCTTCCLSILKILNVLQVHLNFLILRDAADFGPATVRREPCLEKLVLGVVELLRDNGCCHTLENFLTLRSF